MESVTGLEPSTAALDEIPGIFETRYSKIVEKVLQYVVYFGSC